MYHFFVKAGLNRLHKKNPKRKPNTSDVLSALNPQVVQTGGVRLQPAVNTPVQGFFLSSHSESFITALYDIIKRACSVFMKWSAQWGSVRVRMFTANREKFPRCDSLKKKKKGPSSKWKFTKVTRGSSISSTSHLELQFHQQFLPWWFHLQEKEASTQ